jgi:predicted dehydrogenase
MSSRRSSANGSSHVYSDQPSLLTRAETLSPDKAVATVDLAESKTVDLAASKTAALRFGVIGYGYWGPNVVRNLHTLEEAEIVAVCDRSAEALRRAQRLYPYIETMNDVSSILKSSKIDAVAIVTPVWTHFDLAKAALESGKHVFVEKPLAATSAQTEQLIELAEKRNLTLMVDHTFLFTGPVRKMRQLIDEQILGELYYYDSTRVNLGLFQHDVNVVWDLAPHDLSIMDYLIREKAEAVAATGASHLNGHTDVAFITVYFPRNVIAHINVNWLSPVKVRTTLIGGEKRMLVWNDLEADEKIKIYDKGVDVTNGKGIYELLVSYRSGDMFAPRIDQAEALGLELKHFVECVRNGSKPLNDGAAGLRIVKMLEAADKSVRNRGALTYL